MRALWLLIPAVFLFAVGAFAYTMYGKPSLVPPECVVGECPTELRAHDSGGSFVYAIGGRFKVTLAEAKHPPTSYECDPADVILAVETGPRMEPLYTVTFQGAAEGSCLMTNDRFRARIIVTKGE